MELALSLGDAPARPFSFIGKTPKSNKDLGFCMGLDCRSVVADEEDKVEAENGGQASDPSLQLLLLPSAPAPVPRQIRLPWLSDHLISEPGSSDGSGRALDVNRVPAMTSAAEDDDDRAVLSSPNSAISSFPMEFCIGNSGPGGRSKRDLEIETERTSSRASDEEDNGLCRKKLRLSKEQSAFLEESFKEHSTLNPKQKLGLAKQLNLRPRQVEVWFQNRRARTKLKQTEVDCEYLKRCCETLTEENRRLQKELQELRALKTSHPFYMQLPATTLTMCPSCERVANSSSFSAAAGSNSKPTMYSAGALCLGKSLTIHPFSHQTHQAAS